MDLEGSPILWVGAHGSPWHFCTNIPLLPDPSPVFLDKLSHVRSASYGRPRRRVDSGHFRRGAAGVASVEEEVRFIPAVCVFLVASWFSALTGLFYRIDSLSDQTTPPTRRVES